MPDILKRIGGYILVGMLLGSVIGFWIAYFQEDMRDMLMLGFALTWFLIGIEKVKKNA